MHAAPSENRGYESTDSYCDENHKEIPRLDQFGSTWEIVTKLKLGEKYADQREIEDGSYGKKSVPTEQTTNGTDRWNTSSLTNHLSRHRYHQHVPGGSNIELTEERSFLRRPEIFAAEPERWIEKSSVLLGATPHGKRTSGNVSLKKK